MKAKLEKMTTEDQKNYEIFRESSTAIVRHLDNISVCILGINENGDIDKIGSGTCINIGNEYLIATAAHVIYDHQNKMLDIIANGLPPNLILHPDAKGFEGGNLDDDIDVGYLKLSMETVSRLGKNFIEIDRISPRVSEVKVGLVVASGYPVQLSNFNVEQKHLNVMPIAYHTHSLRTESVGGSATHDLFFDYPKDGNEVFGEVNFDKLPDAPGLSGGGLWISNITKKEGIWSTNDMKLIGIERSWHPNDRWIRGTQIQHWLNLIKIDMPNLGDEINKFLDE